MDEGSKGFNLGNQTHDNIKLDGDDMENGEASLLLTPKV